MESYQNKEEYLNLVKSQIRCKKIQDSLIEEIEAHIQDQMDEYSRCGLPYEEAETKTLHQLGDPVIIGVELDRVHRPKTDWTLLFFTLLLVILGAGLQYVVNQTIQLNSTIAFVPYLFTIFFGIALMIAIYFIDYSFLGKYPFLCYIGIFILLFVVLCQNSFEEINGAYSYLSFPLLLFVPVYGGILYRFRGTSYKGIILCGILFEIPALYALFYVNRLSVFLTLNFCGFFLLSIAVWKKWFCVSIKKGLLLLWAPIFCFFLLASAYLLTSAPAYQLHRLNSLLHPSQYAEEGGYLPLVIRNFLAHANWIGETTISSLGSKNFSPATIQSLCPELNTNYILTFIFAHFGILAGGFFIFLIILFLVRIFILSFRQKNALGFLISLGCSCLFALQVLLYLMSNLGIILLGPLSLPFLSYGSQALLVNFCLIGFILSVFRNTNIIQEPKKIWPSSPPSIF